MQIFYTGLSKLVNQFTYSSSYIWRETLPKITTQTVKISQKETTTTTKHENKNTHWKKNQASHEKNSFYLLQ